MLNFSSGFNCFPGNRPRANPRYFKAPQASILMEKGVKEVLEKATKIYKPLPICNDETDISQIHDYICDKLSKSPDLTNLREKEQNLLEQLSYPVTQVDYDYICDDLENLQEAINILETGKIKELYLEETQALIDEWKKYMKEYKPVVKVNGDIDPERFFLVHLYIQTARKYLPEVKFEFATCNKSNSCSLCWRPMQINEDESLYCDNCDIYRTLNIAESASDNIERIVPSSNYVNKVTFEKTILKYEGRQDPGWDLEKNPNWNIEIMTNLFKEYALANGYIIERITPRETRRIFEILFKTKKGPFNKHYDDAILFTHRLNGWELPNVEDYYNDLFADHDTFYKYYSKHKGNKDSAMNAQHLLFKLIERRQIPHRIENFKLADTEKILIENDRITRDVFAEAEEQRQLDIRNGINNDMPWTFRNTT